jgi:aspartyl-tRNA(Asn)/glutamyl-tRNA(Gln) amidotransferase subunit B
VKDRFEAVIGLEVHAQLRTATKIFCGCPTTFGRPANTNVCPVCAGLPGVLPVLNRRVVELALRAVAATGGRVPARSVFARKNYFYPDLPKGYQISQYESPLSVGGGVDIVAGGSPRTIGLTRIHLEEDAGKLIHGENLGDPGASFVDLNRAGVPLIEIVSEPDLRTPEEAREYLATLRDILLFTGVCDGNMEEGSFRCDANVSVRPRGETRLGTKVEIKNMNSFRNVARALEYEIDRQLDQVAAAEKIVQETRLWDADRGVSVSMRGKEEAHDYRYFPEPDLVPVAVDEAWLARVAAGLPELRPARRDRFASAYGLPEYDAGVLTESPELADYFETTVGLFAQPKKVSNWIMTELLRLLRESGRDIGASPVTPEGLAGLLKLVEEGTVSGKMAKEVFGAMYAEGRPAADIVAERGLSQNSDAGSLEAIVDAVLAASPAEVAAYRGGKDKLFGFFVGRVMKESRGSANPGLVNDILRNKLS